MKDTRLIKMKLAAESDFEISSQAFRLLARLLSRIYTDRYALAREQFPLDYRTAARLLGSNSMRLDTKSPQMFAGADQKTVYRRLGELERAFYIERTEIRGCPPIQFYKLQIGRFNSSSIPPSQRRKK
jgi:hypothetical protein